MSSQTFGSRAQVWHGTAEKTKGGLTKSKLMKNKHGRIVSRRKHNMGKKSIKHLKNMGYVAKKGKFTLFHKSDKKGKKGSHTRKKGGAPYGYSLSPSEIHGITNTSGNELQFVAGNAN